MDAGLKDSNMSKEAFLIKRRKFLGTVLGTIAASSVGSSLQFPRCLNKTAVKRLPVDHRFRCQRNVD
jgi:hypothetical protein